MKISRKVDGQSQIPMETVESHWHRIFSKYDHDDDGKIPLLELYNAVQDSAFTHDIPPHAVKALIQRHDRNQDGFITFNEFLAMVEHAEGKAIFGHWLQTYIHYTIPRRSRKRVVVQSDVDGEYEEQYSCSPPAIGMLLISLIEISVFIYDLSTQHVGYIDGPGATAFIYNPHRRKEAWRYLTYMFVHVGPFHLIVNLAVQILLGIPLEMVHGWWRVLIVYFCGVVAGSLGTSVSDPYVYLAGASGGVYAIIAAHLATIIINWSEMQFAFLQLLVFLVLACMDVGTAVYQRYVLNVNEQIGYVAHLTGALAGLLIGLYVLRNLQVHTWERTLCWCALVLYGLLMISAVFWNIFCPDFFPPQSI